jgi:glycosyltransferase involved in cell wall biosynthesis
MEIVCNTRCTHALLTGTQRYTTEILKELPVRIKTVSPAPELSRGMKGHLWEQLILPGKVNKNLLWSPSNSGPVYGGRQVVTIHDVVSFDHPEWLNTNYVRWYNVMLPLVLKKATHIITISKFTKQRLMKLFGTPESKISLIYNGIDSINTVINNDGPDIAIPFKRYILSLGSLEPRKNIPLLLNAWEKVLPEIPEDIGLIVVGEKGNKKVFKDAGIKKIPTRVHFTGHIPDIQLKKLLSGALVFVYISMYEGFGLPPAEAMGAGIPVISSNTTAMPEVIEEAGVLIDPYSETDCCMALKKLILNDSLRSDLSARSLNQAQKFSWRDTALQTYNVLKSFA